MTLPVQYFDDIYAASADPWGFSSRWYEQRKYAMTLAALPLPRFGSALEVGTSIGILTSGLAKRCDSLVSIDASATALATARERVPSTVELVQGMVPAHWPHGAYDLVVLSEVGYYLDAADLERLLDLVERDLAPDGAVLACHWRHPVEDYPQSGDQVHAALARWPRSSRTEEEDFLLDVLMPGGAVSVARRQGLA